MFWSRWIRVSLARKISLLFGTAVLLTIAATLAFPWLQMTALDEQAMLLQAKRVASIAYQAVDLREPNWSQLQMELGRSWPALARELEVRAQPPRLVRVGTLIGGGFQRDAMKQLIRFPQQRYYWRIQDNGRLFRFAMAIRSTAVDPYPSRLRGLIDIRLPIPHAPSIWNAVVTILAGSSGAVLAILVFYMVTQRLVLSPVRLLRSVARKVTKGDIEVRSSISSGDEFEQLSHAFNDMLTHLKRAQEAQEKINRSLDIRLGELAETNVALFESNRLKSEFLANVTHELRTPLVSIIGFAELLRDASQSPDTNRERLLRYSENILNSGRNLLDIINDLLDLAKMEAGELELHLTEFSLAGPCQDLIDFLQPLADKQKLQLSLQMAGNLPRCRSDLGKVKQILFNLLSNALKFTPTGGRVSLRVERNGTDSVRLIVRDTGIGIPQDQHDVVFEKFRQLDASKTREHAGTGLGLAITKDLVNVLGGTIRLKSREGLGSTFIVELPIQVKAIASRPRIRLT